MRVPVGGRGRVALTGISRGQRSGGVPVSAPSGGWDADSPLSAMKEDRAIQIDNWFPSANGAELRKGFWRHSSTGSASPVETLMPYHAAASLGDRLFAAAGDKVFDVTNRNVAPVAVVTGLTSGRWQFVNMANAGVQVLWMCNGSDAPRYYNGAAWVTPTITGIVAANIINVTSHKKRLWFVRKNSLDAAYLGVDAIQGAATEFPLAGVFSKGGYLVAIGSWSTDGGEGGLDDLIVFITSRGQVAAYRGTNPENATDFEYLGVWDFSPPLGRRCILRVANDLALITQEGVLPLSTGINTDRSALANAALTKRIRNAMSQAARQYGKNFGWQLVAHPTGNMAILNVPLAEGIDAHQYVMNTLNGAWCRFTGQRASCWGNFGDGIYFGGPAGVVYRADISNGDYGQDLVADIRCAFTSARRPGLTKIFSLLKPIITTDGDLSPAVGLDTDYESSAFTEAAFGTGSDGTAVWDEFNWDDADWSEDMITTAEWLGVAGVGEMASIRMRIVVPGKTGAEYGSAPICRINGFSLIYEAGANL